MGFNMEIITIEGRRRSAVVDAQTRGAEVVIKRVEAVSYTHLTLPTKA